MHDVYSRLLDTSENDLYDNRKKRIHVYWRLFFTSDIYMQLLKYHLMKFIQS